MNWKRCRNLLFIVPLLILGVQVQATMILQLNLEEMTDRAGKIFRGTVVGIEMGTIEAGGGELPTVTYRFKVDELYKGEPTLVKGDDAMIEIRMVGTLKPERADENGRIKFSVFRDIPTFKEGGDYLLFTSSESAIGLCTTIGLGQGAFKVFQGDGEMQAVNEFNNAGLGLNGPGPVRYATLSAKINELLGQ